MIFASLCTHPSPPREQDPRRPEPKIHLQAPTTAPLPMLHLSCSYWHPRRPAYPRRPLACVKMRTWWRSPLQISPRPPFWEKSSMSCTASRMTSKRPREEEEFVYSRKIGL
uniref:Uncharacterized protein n=1 Tax=Triticum urartu TaxID=4572 RepID=A0A8R7Q2A1_TRIUA